MLGQMAHLLVALADNIMVGKLGAAQLAAVSLGNTLVFIALSIGIGFSFSITPLIAEAHGKGDQTRIKTIFDHGILLCVINGSLLTLLLFASKPILYYLDQPPEVVALAIPYMEWVAISLIPLMFFQAIKQFADGLSKTFFPMLASILANVVNVLVNYLLIYGAWGFPRLEVEGAAIGTLVSRVLMVVLIMMMLAWHPFFKTYFQYFRIHSIETIKKLTGLGFPTAFQMFFEVALFTAAIFLSGVLGTESQAANQIALNLSALTFMVGVGLGVTATIRVGNQLGLNRPMDLRRIARSIFIMTVIVETVFALFFISFNDFLPYIYIQDEVVVALAAELLLVAAVFQLSDGLQVVLLGALRGFQDVWMPLLICVISYAMVGFPVMYGLGIYGNMGVTGIWIGLLAGLTTSAGLMFWRYRVLSHRLILAPGI